MENDESLKDHQTKKEGDREKGEQKKKNGPPTNSKKRTWEKYISGKNRGGTVRRGEKDA